MDPTTSKAPTLPIKKRILALLNEPLDYSMRSLSNRQTATHEAPYECKECGNSFKLLERLKAHLKRHRIKRSGRYTCTICSKTFVQQSSLITHKRIHTGERPYNCELCFRQYGDLSTFTKHKRTHSGEKPYECKYCFRRFTQSGNCLRHTRSVHKKGKTPTRNAQKLKHYEPI